MYFLSAVLPKKDVSVDELKDYVSVDHRVYLKTPPRALGAKELGDFLREHGQSICENFQLKNFVVVPLIKKPNDSKTTMGFYIRGSVNSSVGPIIGLYLANINRDIKQLRTTIWHELFHAYCELQDNELGEEETVVEAAAIDFDDVYIVRNGSLEVNEFNTREQDGYINLEEILKQVEFKHDFMN